MDDLIFDGWDTAEATLKRQARHTRYVTLSDRTVRDQEEPLGRFDYTEACAVAYLRDGANTGFGAGDLGAFEDPEVYVPDEPSLSDDPYGTPSGDPPGPAELAEAARRWVQELVARNMAGEGWRRFRLKLWGVKGTPIDTATFVCRSMDPLALEGPGPLIPAPMPPLPARAHGEDQEVRGSVAKALRDLADAYGDFRHMLLTTQQQHQMINNGLISRLARQLEQTQASNERLTAAVLESKANELEMREESLAVRGTDVRSELAREGLKTVSSAVHLFLAQRGLSTELLPVLQAANTSTELRRALADPRVRKLMEDPKNLRDLAQMLEEAARVAPEPGGGAPTAQETAA